MDKPKVTDRDIVDSFRDAMKDGQIYVMYQPQINHATGIIIGAEALMRWRHPRYGVIPPAEFIPALEHNGLIHDADLYVFDLICRFHRACINAGVPLLPISFNVSRYDFCQCDYVSELEHIRQKYDVPVKYLCAEITESSAVGGVELIRSFLHKLHTKGYIVEMDDFGSGYSSLNVLSGLDVDVIKFDMQFFTGGIHGRGGIIIRSVVNMAKCLELSMIAEGVETGEQADFLMELGCLFIQGYFYSKPVSAQQLIDMIIKSQT